MSGESLYPKRGAKKVGSKISLVQKAVLFPVVQGKQVAV